MSKKRNQFVPDYVVPPGDTLLETIVALGMSQAELAERSGRPKKTINEIIKGKAAITAETALQFETVLGIPASFWNNLEQNYQETLARINETKKLQQQINWLKKIPISHLVKRGWIRYNADKVQQLKEALNFFGVASPEQWNARWLGPQVSFRKSKAFQSDPGAVASWLRRGELLVQGIRCMPFDPVRLRAALAKIRTLTAQPPEVFQQEVANFCAEAGVAVVFVPEIPGIRACGATWWANSTKAVIQLSLRYKRDDQLWFSFFHEAGHILLHGKKDRFIEDDEKDVKEKEADEFAAELLIPKRDFQRFVSSRRFIRIDIGAFARAQGIAPGIVVGRLQHEDHLPHSHLNDLKRRLVWKS